MTWETLWAIGRYDLQLTEGEFWRMVPRQFFALMERRRLRRLEEEQGPAMIITALSQVFGGKKAKNVKVTDYMPSWQKGPRPEKEDMPVDQQLAIVKELHAAFGGK